MRDDRMLTVAAQFWFCHNAWAGLDSCSQLGGHSSVSLKIDNAWDRYN